MIKKDQLQKVMRQFSIFDKEDAENAIGFVRELLELEADDTAVNEPYATRSIAEMRHSAGRVGDLQDVIEENL